MNDHMMKILGILIPPLIRGGWNKCRPVIERRKIISGNSVSRTFLIEQLEHVLNVLSYTKLSSLDNLENSCLSFLSNHDSIYNKPHMKEWLNNQKTRDMFIEKAIGKFSGDSFKEHNEFDELLASTYMEISGENNFSARQIIELTHKLLVCSVTALLDAQSKIIDEFGQLRFAQMSIDFKKQLEPIILGQERINERLNNIRIGFQSQPLIDKIAQDALKLVLWREPFEEVDSFNEISELASRAELGDLSSASRPIRVTIFREMARACCNKNDSERGEKWLKEAKALSADEEFVVDNLRIRMSAGRVDEVLTEAKNIDSLSVREFVFNVLLTQKDNLSALEYYNYQIKDSSLLSGTKLLGFAIKQCEIGDYNFSLKLLVRATKTQIQDCPAIIPIRALIKVAICTGCMEKDSLFSTLPIHPKLVKFDDTPEMRGLRVSALEDATNFIDNYLLLKIPKFQAAIEEVKLWLELEHPDDNFREKKRHAFNELIADTEKAVRYSRFAFDYGYSLDMRGMNKYLNLQKSIGELTFNETIAILLLAMNQDTPQAVLQLLDENSASITKVIKMEYFVSLKAEVLHKCGRRDECEKYINDNSDVIGEIKANTLKSLFLKENLEDPVAPYREGFELTSGEGERRLLIKALEDNHRYLEAAEHLTYFFNKTPSYEEAERILYHFIKCGEYKKANDFLCQGVVQLLIAENSNLQSLNAWIAYFNGDIVEASSILKLLPKNREKNDNNYRLALLIAQETGNWEDGLDELVYAKNNAETLSYDELVRYAGLSWLIKAPGQIAIDLLKAASVKASDSNDAFALTRIYSLAIRIGDSQLKKIAESALTQAQELSTTAEGPLTAVPYSELETIFRQAHEYESSISENVRLGTIPLIFAIQKNGALSNVLAGQMLYNEQQLDWRKKNCIPLFCGNRIDEIPKIKSIAIDRSSLITLAYLNSLNIVFSAFDKVAITNSCMTEFLEDIEKIRFHQASQVTEARLVERLIAEQKVKICKSEACAISDDIPAGLSRDLSMLVVQAKKNNGYVVIAKDEYDTASFLTKKVDLSAIDSVLIDLIEIVSFLSHEGVIAKDNEEEIVQYHKANHLYSVSHKKISRHTQLFLDSYALDCLIRYGIIENLLKVNSEVFISEEMRLHYLGLLSYVDRQSDVEDIITMIRNEVSGGIASGKIQFLIRNKSDEDYDGFSLQALLAHGHERDAIVVDDRFVNKNIGESPIIMSSLDVLRRLQCASVITEQGLSDIYKKLRRCGTVFVPLTSQEVLAAANQSFQQNKQSIELTEFIEYFCMIGKTSILVLPDEMPFILSCVKVCTTAIKDVWINEEVVEAARKKSIYIHKILDALYCCLPTSDSRGFAGAYARTAGAIVALLADANFLHEPSKVKAYFEFVEDFILKADNYLATFVYPSLSDLFRKVINDMVCNHEGEGSPYSYAEILKFCMLQLHPRIKSLLLKDPEFYEKYMECFGQVTICNASFSYNNFLGKIREIANGHVNNLIDDSGNKTSLRVEKTGSGAIQFVNGDSSCELTAGCILTDSTKARQRILNVLKETYDFPRELVRKWKKSITVELTNSDYWELVDDIGKLPSVVLDKIEAEISRTHKLLADSLTPQSVDTFVALFGKPMSHNIDGFFLSSAVLRGRLLARNLKKALYEFGPSSVIPSKQMLDTCLHKRCDFSVEFLQHCASTFKDPFSLMLIFDICAALSCENNCYVAIGKDIIKRIVEASSSNEFIDFEISLHFVSPSLVQKNILKDFPLYFQRLCAWGWSGYVSRILNKYEFDRTALLKCLRDEQNDLFLLSGLTGGLESPLWQNYQISKPYIVGFLCNRIIASIDVFCTKGVPKEWSDLLLGANSKKATAENNIYVLHPTPFSGLSQHYRELIIPDEISLEIVRRFEMFEAKEFLLSLYACSHLFRVSPEHIEKIIISCKRLKTSYAEIKDDDLFKIVEGVSRIASINYSTELAETIVEWILSRIVEQHKNEEFLCLCAVLNVFNSYSNSEQALNFLREKSSIIANVSSDKDAINRCLSLIRRVEFCFPEFRHCFLAAKSIFTLGKYAN
ncbi:hypothetical protein JMF94_13640 [Desulfovibrio sp. UIB00]|uniref:hypothetical protein n=1 Tax=Desulfovibrio sp. UIB00 TaxID=2804314 RepID=UPI001F0D7CED|nr:hypothetical protein [Desulfovibrio sp. UIB00]MCH5146122.1 hypothetical protein [Desulfovibrio sp. UIB00]